MAIGYLDDTYLEEIADAIREKLPIYSYVETVCNDAALNNGGTFKLKMYCGNSEPSFGVGITDSAGNYDIVGTYNNHNPNYDGDSDDPANGYFVETIITLNPDTYTVEPYNVNYTIYSLAVNHTQNTNQYAPADMPGAIRSIESEEWDGSYTIK